MDFFRSVFFGIDAVIYTFISTVYTFIRQLMQVGSIFDEATIKSISNSVYSIIGIVMIIKMSFSVVGYIVNPDTFYDQKKGFGSIVTRVFIVLGLIVIVPYMFNFAFKLEQTIIDNSIIEKVILGKSFNFKNGTDNTGDLLATTTLSAFLKCKTGQTCLPIRFGENTTIWEIQKNINEKEGLFSIYGDYIYQYVFLLSTICGIFVLAMLIIFAFDIALRIVKLGFLQIIAPIPIISYLDPKNTFTEGVMGKWLKITMSTYLSLFTRLASIAFLIFIVNVLGSGEIKILKENFLLTVMILIGVLMFVKEMPKLLGDILGTDMSAGFGNLKSLNPLGKMAGGGLIGGALGLGAGLGLKGAASLGGGLAGGLQSKLRGGSFLQSALKSGAAAQKGVPLKGSIGKQLGGLSKAYRTASDIGASDAYGYDYKTGLANRIKDRTEGAKATAAYNQRNKLEDAVLDKMNSSQNPKRDPSVLFKGNKRLESLFTDAKLNKENVTASKKTLRTSQDDLAKAIASGNQDSISMAQAAVLQAEKAVTSAEGKYTVSNRIFEEELKMPQNASYSRDYNLYKDLKDTGRIQPAQVNAVVQNNQPAQINTGTIDDRQISIDDYMKTRTGTIDERQISVDDYIKTRTGATDERQISFDQMIDNTVNKTKNQDNQINSDTKVSTPNPKEEATGGKWLGPDNKNVTIIEDKNNSDKQSDGTNGVK